MNPNDPNNSNDPTTSLGGAAPVGDQSAPQIPTLQQDDPNIQQPNVLPATPSAASDVPDVNQPPQPFAGQPSAWPTPSSSPVDQPDFSANNLVTPVPDNAPATPVADIFTNNQTPPAPVADTSAFNQPNWNNAADISQPAAADLGAGLSTPLEPNPQALPFLNTPPATSNEAASPTSSPFGAVPPVDTSSANSSWLPPVSAASETANTTPPSAPGTTDFSTSMAGGAQGLNEAVPTDLSHLIDNSGVGISSNSQPSTMIVPSTSEAEQAVTTKQSGGFPKWLFAVAGIVLIAVMAGSAYFILGVGKNEVVQPPVPEEQPIPVIPPQVEVPTIPPLNTATTSGEANFSNLQGSIPNEASASPSPAMGSSAIDRLKSRVSPTPSV